MSINSIEKIKSILNSNDDLYRGLHLLADQTTTDFVFVDGVNGSDINDGTTIDSAKATINGAIMKGDITVIVLPGEYDEFYSVSGILIDHPNVTILSAIKGQAKVSNSNFAATAVFTIWSDDVYIQGFQISGSKYTEGIISTGARSSIENCVFNAPLENGVRFQGTIYGGNQGIVRNCCFNSGIINDCIELFSFNDDRLEDCVIEHNIFYSSFDNAIHLNGWGVKNNFIKQNKIYGKGSDVDYGITINFANENIVKNNSIFNITLPNLDCGDNNIWESNRIGSSPQYDRILTLEGNNFKRFRSSLIINKEKSLKRKCVKKDTVLVVGNGLTKGFINYFQFNFDTDSPIDWDTLYHKPFSETEVRFLDDAIDLKEYILDRRKKFDGIKDYELLEGFLNSLGSDWNVWSLKQKRLYHQLSNYFAITYSHLQKEMDNYPLHNWPYIQKFDEIRMNLLGIVSFNYDILIERILDYFKHYYHRIGMDKTCNGLVLFKPHGSIDFDKGHETMNLDIQEGSLCFQNEFTFDHLEKKRWLEPRAQNDIILPTSSTFNLKLSFVRYGYRWVSEKFCDAKRCIFLGLSYWYCDRPELDLIIKSLDRNCEIILANPNRPDQMLEVLTQKKFNNVRWDNKRYIA